MRHGHPEANVVLCGSFSPLTHLHIHVLACAAREAQLRGYQVRTARLSPVHGGYGKPGLLPTRHRLDMARLGAPTWATVDDWEARQARPSRSHAVAAHVHADAARGDALVVFACGADLVRSMAQCAGWTRESVARLLDQAVLAVVARPDVRLDDALDSDVFCLRRDRVWLVDCDESPVSSTLVRDRVRNGESIDGLTPDPVVDYIRREKLFLGRFSA